MSHPKVLNRYLFNQYTGGHDGAVNIWRDFAYQNKPKLILRDRLTPCIMTAHLVILNKYERSVGKNTSF